MSEASDRMYPTPWRYFLSGNRRATIVSKDSNRVLSGINHLKAQTIIDGVNHRAGLLTAAQAILACSDYSDDTRPLMNALRAVVAQATGA